MTINLWLLKVAAWLGQWKFVDTFIGEAINPVGIGWAKEEGLFKKNANLRDLAASILEKESSERRFDEVTERNLLIRAREDPSEAVRFRAICALWTHGRNNRDDPFVWPRMQRFAQSGDEGIVKVAREYLAKADEKQSTA